MFARAMSGFGRNNTETADITKKSSSATNGSNTRRAFGRDITNSTNSLPDTGKDALGKVMPPAPAVSTARVDDIMIEGNFNNSMGDRPYMDRPSDDIDARDVDNPLLCTEYVNQMYDNFSIMEKETAVSPTYMSKQTFINEKMRAILCDWLVSILYTFIASYYVTILHYMM